MSERTFWERAEAIGGHHYIRLKGGRLVGFWDMISAAESAQTSMERAVSRAFKLAVADDSGRQAGDILRGYDMERLEWFIDTLESYVSAMRIVIEKQRGTRTEEERIAQLRNTTGRTPEEAAAYLRKADQLEAALKDRR